MMSGVLLVGHGSRDRAGNQQFLDLAFRLSDRLTGLPLQPSFLDHAEPSIQSGIDRLVEQGISAIAVVPLFLFAAGHAKIDVPAQLAQAAQRHRGLTFHYGEVLGVEPTLVEVCAQRLAAVAEPCSETAVLLIGRGSSDEGANEGLRQVTRALHAATGYGWVETAYCDVASPRVDEGLQRCLAHGAKRVVMLPYFLFRGVLMSRLQTVMGQWQQAHPRVDFRFAGTHGLAQGETVLDLALRRAGALVAI